MSVVEKMCVRCQRPQSIRHGIYVGGGRFSHSQLFVCITCLRAHVYKIDKEVAPVVSK